MRKLLVITALVLFTGVVLGQTLKSGGIIAIRTYTFTLQPDVTIDQLLDFWKNKYIPLSEQAYPGTKSFVLIGERGEYTNEIAEITYFESKELRDKYWPTEDEAGPYDEKATEMMAPISEQWEKFVADGKAVVTDYVIH